MLPGDIVGRLYNLLFFVVGSSKIHIVKVRTCPLGFIVPFWGYANVEHTIVRFDITPFSVLGEYKVFYRLQVHKDFASLITFVFVDLCQNLSCFNIFF